MSHDGHGCTLSGVSHCSLDYATIKYIPTLTGNALFLSVFGLLFAIQALQSYHYRTWSYSISMMIGLVLEVVGYVGRVQMHYNPFLADPFLTYIICLTIGPVFFTAAIYLTLSRLVVHYGPQHSRFSPKTISITFMTCDFVALVLQAGGGAIADTANDIPGRDLGTHVMVAGLGFQVLSLLVFMGIAGELAWKVKTNRALTRAVRTGGMFDDGKTSSDGRFSIFVYALTISTVLILTRSTFRVAELAKGFTSKLANEEVPFIVLEGVMILLATTLLTAFHPGQVFGQKWVDAGWNWKKEQQFRDLENSGSGKSGQVSQQSILMK